MAEHHRLGSRSLKNLEGVKADLHQLVILALKYSPHDFTITEGIRSKERQAELVRTGKSTTMNSKHLTGDAVDFYPYYSGSVQVNAPMKMFKEIADAFKKAAKELNMKITWGGDWKNFIDCPHIQVDR